MNQSCELPLTPANRLRLAEAFRHNPRVDYSIDCVIEGQMGRARVDDPAAPTAWCITVGPFRYFAGDAHGPGGRALSAELPPFNLLMPSPLEWTVAVKERFGDRLVTFPRYSFDAGTLSEAGLSAVLNASPHRDRVLRADAALLARPDNYIEFEDFDSAEDFLARGIATAISAALLLECVRRGLRPNWDAANPESCALAGKLGYTPIGTYESYYYPPAS